MTVILNVQLDSLRDKSKANHVIVVVPNGKAVSGNITIRYLPQYSEKYPSCQALYSQIKRKRS
jgi:hypothetical protein